MMLSILANAPDSGRPVQVMSGYHTPVLLPEAINALNIQPGGRYIDCTLGTAGHSTAIIEASSPGGQLLGIDADPQAIATSQKRLAAYSKDILLLNDNFAHLKILCDTHGFYPVHGILFDLGLSSPQLEADDRGFSFQQDSPLDMRFDPTQTLTAADIVNTYSEFELAQTIARYGEDLRSRQIASQIIASRPIKTTLDLTKAVFKATGTRRGKIHPATRTFQALRIAVNRELEQLATALSQAIDVLGFQGRLVVISYHSLEDRLVKNMLKKESKGCICPPEVIRCVCKHEPCLRPVNTKAIKPSPSEIEANPRSRSARLRAAERI